jgi:hypothetical protein
LAAEIYGDSACLEQTSPATCTTAQDTYDAQVRPMIGQLQGMGASMDAMMGSMNHMDWADMGCSANATMAELDRHRTVACASSTDMAPNKVEAQQHVAVMVQWASHEMGRSHDVGSMTGMSMGQMNGGTSTGHCVRNADGSYTFQL